jgi:transposase-like protein
MGTRSPMLECPTCGEKWRIKAGLLNVKQRPVGFIHRCQSCGDEWTDEQSTGHRDASLKNRWAPRSPAMRQDQVT